MLTFYIRFMSKLASHVKLKLKLLFNQLPNYALCRRSNSISKNKHMGLERKIEQEVWVCEWQKPVQLRFLALPILHPTVTRVNTSSVRFRTCYEVFVEPQPVVDAIAVGETGYISCLAFYVPFALSNKPSEAI